MARIDTIVFDRMQVTCPTNRNRPDWNDAGHTLSAKNADMVWVIVRVRQ